MGGLQIVPVRTASFCGGCSVVVTDSAKTEMISRRPLSARELNERICPSTRKRPPANRSAAISTSSAAMTGSTSAVPDSRSTSSSKRKKRRSWLLCEYSGSARSVPQRVI